MKKWIIDLNEMSDSKEFYENRPNPFISLFVYCILGFFLAGIIYSFFGEIEITATASGIVRPNEKVSTVSSLINGRIRKVYYTDGSFVKKGDKLLDIDMSEIMLELNSSKKEREALKKDEALIDKFLKGIEDGRNPFSSKQKSKEYSYHIKYKNYELGLKTREEQLKSDKEKIAIELERDKKKIKKLSQDIEGLRLYKKSIKNGKNLVKEYPVYEAEYKLYKTNKEALNADYETQRNRLQLEDKDTGNDYYISYYEDRSKDYWRLIESIKAEQSLFGTEEKSTCKLLYDGYLAKMEEFDQEYKSAKLAYEFFKNGGGTGAALYGLFAYDKTKLEGYRLLKQSILYGTDMFFGQETKYHTMYLDYKAEYDRLSAEFKKAEEAYENKKNRKAEIEATNSVDKTHDISEKDEKKEEEKKEEEKKEEERLLFIKNEALKARDDYRNRKLAEIEDTILGINEAISSKELSTGINKLPYDTENARLQMEKIHSLKIGFTKKVLADYGKIFADMKAKAEEYRVAKRASNESESNRENLVDSLDIAKDSAGELKKDEEITKIESRIQSFKTEMDTAKEALRMNQILQKITEAKEEGGKSLEISLETVEKIGELLREKEGLERQIKEVENRIKRLKEQMERGTLTAERSGIINEILSVVEGDVVTADKSLATIIPSGNGKFTARIFVRNIDIASIKIGDTIRYRVPTDRNAGTVEGVVTAIAGDSIIRDGEHSGYFMVEGSIPDVSLERRGERGLSLGIGMQIEAKIVTKTKKIYHYVLEKLDIF